MRAPRSAAFGAVASLLLLSTLIGGPPRPETTRMANVRPAATVTWPPSAGLLIAEVVTGGASASDEYVEITNAGGVPADLAGLELAYVTSSGSTVTRKATWSELTLLATGQHLLVANALGTYASTADATYSGGFATTGGVLVLRPVGGAPVDAVGWGDATNSFVEGAAAVAPPAGQSIERRPGGSGGNVADTNQNAADWSLLTAPIPQNRSAVPVPSATPGPSLSPTPSGTPSPSPDPSATPTPAPSPSPDPSAAPTPEPSGQPSAAPTTGPSPSPAPSPEPTPTPQPSPEPSPAPTEMPEPSPTPTPTPTQTPPPSPAPTPTPTPSPSPSPTPTPIATISIAAARAAADGTSVTLEGVLSTPLGVLEAGRGGFLQDETAGIAVYAASALEPVAAGWRIRVTGNIDDRYGQRTVRLDGPPIMLAAGPAPFPVETTTGAALEPLEGRRIRVRGTVLDAATALSDGPAITVDDGSGSVRVIFAGIAGANVPARDSVISVAGTLGQRDSSGIGTSGYRLFVIDPLDVVEEPAPSPSPTPTDEPVPSPSPSAAPSPTPTLTPTPTRTPSASSSPTATPTVTPSPTPTPSPTGEPTTIRSARGAAIGTTVHVRGGVTAEAGRVGLPPLGVVADETGGIFIRFPDGILPARGALLDVTGRLADPYGQLEIRPTAEGIRFVGAAAITDPLPIGAASLGEAVEGRVVTLDASLDAAIVRESSGDLVLRLRDAAGAPFTARATRASGLQPDLARRGDRVRLVGIVGQRASARGKLDGYRLWLRSTADLSRSAGGMPGPTPSPGATPRPGASASPSVTIAAALRLGSGSVTVEGTVSVASTLLDSTGRRSVVQDATAAVEFLVPRDASAPRPGDRVRVVGSLGRAYGAPRITATTLVILGHAAEPVPLVVRGALSASLEWRLVSVEGIVAEQRRLGDRWRAELDAAGGSIPVAGLPGAGIAASALVEGSRVRIVGIVRRPNPAASDQHFVMVPRSPADIRVLAPAPAAGSGGTRVGASRGGAVAASAAFGPVGAGDANAPVSADAAALAGLAGRSVLVGGLVVTVDAVGLVVDDGTGSARVELVGDARSLLPLLGPGDAIGAAGVVEAGTPPIVRVTDPASLVRLGDLGEALPLGDEVVRPDDADTGSFGSPAADPAGSAPAAPDPVRAGPSASMTAGAGSIGALATAGALLMVARRRREQRTSRARIARRVAELGALFAGGRVPPPTASSSELDPPSTVPGNLVREPA